MNRPPMARPPSDSAFWLLGIKLDTIVGEETLDSSIGGACLIRLALAQRCFGTATAYSSTVLKRIEPLHGWLGVASRDEHIREVTLWESGLLQTLPAQVETAIQLAAREDSAAAAWLRMRDMRSRLQPDPTRTPLGAMPSPMRLLLHALAHMHAAFWERADVRAPALGLMRAREALLLVSPASIEERLAAGDHNPYLPLARAGWEAFFRHVAPEQARVLERVFAKPDAWITAIERLPATLAHGDVWGPNLALLPPTRTAPRRGHRILLLDWALAMAGPATYDPLWVCGTWHDLDPVRVLAIYRADLMRSLGAHGIRLRADVWRQLADAGYLRTALTCGESFGRDVEKATPGSARERAQSRLEWWAKRAALAAERLVPESASHR